MACGCESNAYDTNGTGSSGNASGSTGSLEQQIQAIFEGKKKLSLLDALQMIAAIATIVGFLKYLFGSK